MKTKLHYIFVLSIVGVIAMIIINSKYDFTSLTISEKRKIHQEFLKNSPFKETLNLSKSERKAIGLPPNKYYEREWELTMNPATGKPEPFKVLDFQKKRNSIKKRSPGDGTTGNNWIDRGPNNVGGRTRVVLFDPNDTSDYNRVFAGGVSGGLWVNNDITNANSSWSLVSGVPGNMNISCITVDPNNSNTWYIGTGEQYTFGAAVGNGVYKTTDGGNNWVHVPIQLSGGGTVGTDFAGIYYINDIVAWNNPSTNLTEVFIGVGTHVYGDASNPTNWLGFQNAGLYKSTDNGGTWARNQSSDLESTFGSNFYYIPNDFEISADNTLWFGSIATPGTVGIGGGLIFSSTDGSLWTESAASPLPNSNRVELAVSSTDPDKLYALTEGTSTTPPIVGSHIYSTTDGFATATSRAKPDDADTGIPANDFTRGQAFYNLVIEVDPTNDEIVYVGGIDLFRCTNGSTTSVNSDWKQISKWSDNNNLEFLNCSNVHADQHAFTFRPSSNNEAIIGCDGGVFYASSLSTAENSNVISSRNKDYNVTQFYYSGYGQNTSNELIISGAQDNGSQFFNGASSGTNSTVDVFGGDGAYSVIDKDGDYMIVSYVYNYHYYYDLPYTGAGYSIESGVDEGDFINPGGLDHNLNILFTNGTDGTIQINRYILGNNSATKAQLSNGNLDGSPTAFKVSPYTTTSTTLIVGTDNGKLLKLSNAEASNLGNIVWEDISGAAFLGSVSAIEFGATENDLLVTFHNYGVTSVWSSSDGGTTWNDKEGNLPDMPVKCILQNPLIPTEVIVGTELGVWATSNFNDASPTWTSSYNGMRDVKVVDLDLRTADNSVLATTFGRGVFTGKFTDPEFVITTANETISVCKPDNAVFNLELIADAGYNTTTTFSASGLPTNAIATFSPTSLSKSGLFTMTISNINNVTPGSYTIQVTGTGNESNSINVVLNVFDNTISNPVLSSPSNGAIGVSVNGTTFSWNSDENVASYDFEISENPGFSSIIESSTTTNNSYALANSLNEGTVYYWRVRGKNDCSTGNFSIQSFQTVAPSLLNCTTYNNNTSASIPDRTGMNIGELTSIINSTSTNTISDINVSLNISHTYVQDLVISLISPLGTEILLFNRSCTNNDNLQVTFDDNGSALICASPVAGTYIPENSLSGFNGENALGNWTLKIQDQGQQDGGTLNNWSLEVCESQPVTVTNSSFTNNTITVATNSTYIFNQSQTDLEASSAESNSDEQIYMLTQLPTKGTIRLNNTALSLGETFSQDDINSGFITYVNTSSITTTDLFKVDITNATYGFLTNQAVNINIDAALSVGESFLSEYGVSIYPTIASEQLFISSQNNLGKTEIELYSITGQLVLKRELNFYKGNVEQISIGRFSSGIYILKLSSEELYGSKKIIIK